jgi:hypothetical protein
MINGMHMWSNVLDLEADEIAAPELAIDGKIEHDEITRSPLAREGRLEGKIQAGLVWSCSSVAKDDQHGLLALQSGETP